MSAFASSGHRAKSRWGMVHEAGCRPMRVVYADSIALMADAEYVEPLGVT
jgi:hypothetical protein